MARATFDTVAALAGTEIGVSDWLTIDQARIDTFADATGDHQWIHGDAARAAAQMPGGKTIAHGFLTLSLIPALTNGLLVLDDVTRVINYGSDKVRFTAMVPVGSRVRARQKLLAVQPKAGGLELVNEVTIELEGSARPACIAQTLILVFK